MPAQLPLRILIVSVLLVIGFNVLAFLAPLPLYRLGTRAQTALDDGAMLLVFAPVVSLIAAILGRDVKHKAVVIWLSSLWLVYWLLILVLYSLTKGR